MNGRLSGWSGVLLASLLVFFLGLPPALVVARGLLDGGVLAALASPAVISALLLSLVTTSLSLLLIVCLGTPLAVLLVRRRFRGSRLLETLIDLPIVLPPSVAGLALLLVFGRRGLLGQPLDALGLAIPFTTLAVVLAQVFVAAPFYVRAARAGIAAVAGDLEDAARVDGGNELAVLRRVTLPLAAAGIAAGLVMSWARALGEFGATIIFAGSIGGTTQTLPLLVYGDFQAGDLDSALAASGVLVVAAIGVLLSFRLLSTTRALDPREM